ncbi:MAG: preprotein translocase subunit YajC [Candidatus Omnitrophota bacterium]
MQPTSANPLISFVPLIFIFIIFYFLLIRPQKLSQKEHQKMIQGLDKNDEVVTTGGVHGKIINVKDKTLVLRVDENVKIEVDKTCIAYLKK